MLAAYLIGVVTGTILTICPLLLGATSSRFPLWRILLGGVIGMAIGMAGWLIAKKVGV